MGLARFYFPGPRQRRPEWYNPNIWRANPAIYLPAQTSKVFAKQTSEV